MHHSQDRLLGIGDKADGAGCRFAEKRLVDSRLGCTHCEGPHWRLHHHVRELHGHTNFCSPHRAAAHQVLMILEQRT